jgi:hypothetical protein
MPFPGFLCLHTPDRRTFSRPGDRESESLLQISESSPEGARKSSATELPWWIKWIEWFAE